MLTTGQRITRFRKKLKLSQDRFAEKLGVSQRTVSYWECDYTLPNGEMIPRFAKTFGNDAIIEIFGEEEENG